MKKFIILMLMALIGKAGISQNYNPAVWAGIVSPAPMVLGVGAVQFNVGNLGNNALANLAQPMVLIVSLSNGIPNNPNPVAAVSGTIANKFTWLYDAASKSYQGTQNQAIAGLEAGSVIISYRITVPSTQASPQNGFNVNITPPAYTNASNTLGDDNVSSYTFGPPGTLPVKLVSFNAAVNNCVSSVNWKSGTESNFSHYQVEYSRNGVDFTAISNVNSKGDNSSYMVSHSPDQGKAYYRLKLVDADGSAEYSQVVLLSVQCGKGSVLVYPNPAKNFLNVSISGADTKGTSAILYNDAGQVVLKTNLQNGSNQLDISRLANGLYQLILANNTGTEKIKVVID